MPRGNNNCLAFVLHSASNVECNDWKEHKKVKSERSFSSGTASSANEHAKQEEKSSSTCTICNESEILLVLQTHQWLCKY